MKPISAVALFALLNCLSAGTLGAPTSLTVPESHDVARLEARIDIDPIVAPKPKDPKPAPKVGGAGSAPGSPGSDASGASDRSTVSDSDEDAKSPADQASRAGTISYADNPGAGNGFGDAVQAMSVYEAKGREGISALKARIAAKTPDIQVVRNEDDLAGKAAYTAAWDYTRNEYYMTRTDFPKLTSANEYPGLGLLTTKNVGFQPDLSKMTQKSVGPEDDPDTYATRASYDQGGKSIFFQDAFKQNNDLIPGHVPLGQINMQVFKSVAGDNAKNLQAFGGGNIMNKETWGITAQCYKDRNAPFNTIQTFKAGTPQFDRYMGCPNIWSKIKALETNSVATGGRVPYEITIIPRQVPGSGNTMTFWVRMQ